MKPAEKLYIGDGVYAADDGYHIVLTTENGLGIQNTVYLDSSVLQSLMNYIELARGVKITVERADA